MLLLAHKAVSRSAIQSPPSSSAFETEMLAQAKSGLTLVGLVAIVDPPRAEIPEVIRTLRSAGIRIFMVTGDFALTAQAIATECGIVTNPSSAVDDVTALARDLSDKQGLGSKPARLSGSADGEEPSHDLYRPYRFGSHDSQRYSVGPARKRVHRGRVRSHDPEQKPASYVSSSRAAT